MKLHVTILLSAVIIAAGLVLASQQANERRLFADDMLPARKPIARADVIKAVQALDQSRLLSLVTNPNLGVTAFQAIDAKAALDGKSIGVFGEAVLPDGKRSRLNFSFERDDFGRWVINGGDSGQIVLPL